MSTGKATGFANRVLNNYFGGPTLARPAIQWFQAVSTVPTASTAGTPLLGRIAVANDPSHFPPASGGSLTNGATLGLGSTSGMTLPPMLGGEFWDAQTGGQRSMWGSMASTDISDRAAVNFPAGSLTLSEA